MKALVFRGKGQIAVEERPKPEIVEPQDAIVKLTKTTICGTDLHILRGDVPSVTPGRILGHEGVGTVESVGPSVSTFKPGDKVVITSITSCATCTFCARGLPSHCERGGWILGNTIDGTQAEWVKIPYADRSLHKAPEGVDEGSLVLISDTFTTALECGVVKGKVRPGSSVAIVGAGPVGLAAVVTAKLYSPLMVIVIDLDENRLAIASEMGATYTVVAGNNAVERVMEITEGKGVDTAIEAVGVPATFELCEEIVAVGGTIANIGVHGTKADLHLEKLWNRNISITTAVVDAVTAPMLIKLVDAGKIDLEPFATHTFPFASSHQAYNSFAAAAANQVLKVVIDFG